MSTYHFAHPQLGKIVGRVVADDLVQFRSLPYASVPRRFGLSTRSSQLSKDAQPQGTYEACDFGPSCIQQLDSIETDLRWNQLPNEPSRSQTQAEDCLRLTLTVPKSALESSDSARLPVLAFIHGGAFVVGSGERQYYDPLAFCSEAQRMGRAVIFASINYRLGVLGFLHSPEAPDLLPPNNGLYDQIEALKWVHAFIAGFGGDESNMTVIGQSAGAMSVSLHSTRQQADPLVRRAIIFSGSGTTVASMTPEQHHTIFLEEAAKLGLNTSHSSAKRIAAALVDAPIADIRKLNAHGSPCAPSDLIPSPDWSTTEAAQRTPPNPWLESQIIASSTYDGSISYMVALGQDRKDLAKIFTTIARARLKSDNADKLLSLYDIIESDSDHKALEKICQIVTDVGFFGAAVSSLVGAEASQTKSYLLQFDIANPFEGSLPARRFATHTWDVVALFGGYDELLRDDMRKGVLEFRRAIIEYCHAGRLPVKQWKKDRQSALLVQKDGLKTLDHDSLSSTRAVKVMELAEEEGGAHGLDRLWEDVVRFFLKTGDKRFAHELRELLKEVGQHNGSQRP